MDVLQAQDRRGNASIFAQLEKLDSFRTESGEGTMMDSGIIEFYSITNTADRAKLPVRRALLKAKEWYEARTVGFRRYYTAKQANVNIEIVARTWRLENISTQDVAKIGDNWFTIKQVQNGFDDDGLEITDFSLERTAEKFDA